jgi:hypothetical protein
MRQNGAMPKFGKNFIPEKRGRAEPRFVAGRKRFLVAVHCAERARSTPAIFVAQRILFLLTRTGRCVQFAIVAHGPLSKGYSLFPRRHGGHWLRENPTAGRQATTDLNPQKKTMNSLELTQRSFDAWNRHDPDAIAALYAEGGTYSSPRAGSQALTGKAIADYAKKVFTAYPDARLEIISIGDTGGGLIASQWVFHGTHTGPYFDGSPPNRSHRYPSGGYLHSD